MKILVAYASKTGSTAGIAGFIGEKLRQKGMQADVRDVSDFRNAGDYDAFIIGSAVYMFHWMKEAKKFVSRNHDILASHPVWLFSSGPVGREAKDPKGRDYKDVTVSGPKEIDEIREAINFRDHHIFFGALNGSRLTGTIGFAYRIAMRSKSAREAMPEGDFRDWNEIEAWTNTIAGALQTPATTAQP